MAHGTKDVKAAPSGAKYVPVMKRGHRAWRNFQGTGPFDPEARDANRLLLHAVDDSTNWLYLREVQAFLQGAIDHGVCWTSAKELDQILAGYLMHMCYAQHLSPIRGHYLVSGMHHFFPELRHATDWSNRALKAWDGVAAVPEGVPICRELVGAAALDMFRRGLVVEGVVTLFSYDCLCREQDWGVLRLGDVASAAGRMGVTFGRIDRGERLKTGAEAGCVVAHPVIAAMVQFLVDDTAPGEPIFPITATDFRLVWAATMGRLKVPTPRPPPHRLRHAGAAEMVARGATLENTRRRGRWAALSSVQRYTKLHYLIRSRADLDRDVLDAGWAFWERPDRAVLSALAQAPAHARHLADRLATEVRKAKRKWAPPQLEHVMADLLDPARLNIPQ